MVRKPRSPSDEPIPWWGYLIVAVAIAVVIVAGVVVWHLMALLPPPAVLA